MALDSTFEILNAALSQAAAATVNTSAVELGRTGLPKGAQLIVILDNPGGPANGDLRVDLELSRDDGSSYDKVASIDLGVLTDDFQGQIAQDIGRSEAWQEYADANLQIRAALVSSAGSGTLTADKLAVYIGQGEVTRWGRDKTADTLFV